MTPVGLVVGHRHSDSRRVQIAGKPDTSEEDITGLHEDISAAFCSLAEVYLTDLWSVS